jgi:hypothetical protein
MWSLVPTTATHAMLLKMTAGIALNMDIVETQPVHFIPSKLSFKSANKLL